MNHNPSPSLAESIALLDPARRHIVEQFISRILVCHDPDVVDTFLAWREDPKIDSILDLAAALDDDHRDQLLFAAEDLFTEQGVREPRASA